MLKHLTYNFYLLKLWLQLCLLKFLFCLHQAKVFIYFLPPKMWDADAKNEKNVQRAKTLKNFLIGSLILLITLYLGLPLVFKYSSTATHNLAFLNLLKNPFQKSIHKPAINFGFEGARNFYLTTPDGESLGVWHLLPAELQAEGASLHTDDPYNVTVAAHYHQWLQDATVFLYCHGAAGNRASEGRMMLYKVINSMGYHVITFDYRGYGDSTGHPTSEQDVTGDARTVLNWLSKHVNTGQIFLWGHSLGTGVVSSLLAKLELEPDNPIVGAVLESAFNNLVDAVRTFPLSKPYARFPEFDFFAVQPLSKGLSFQSEKYLANVTVPLLFLHAEDDVVVPLRLGRKLYESVVSSRQDPSTVTFVSYDKELGYGHTKIYEDSNLPSVVTDFVKRSVERNISFLSM